MRKSELLE